jgi:hypothetical protein
MADVATRCDGDKVGQPLSAFQSVIGVLLLLATSCYVLITLLYVTPSNPLRIKFDSALRDFETWGFQKWTFFAPPPTGNDRLYFAFSPREGSGSTYEVLEDIYRRKQEDHPFNERTEVVDYVVSGTASQITDIMSEVNRYREVHVLLGGDPEYLRDVALRTLDPDEPAGEYARVLLRYAAVIADREGIDREGLKCQIAFVEVPIRPFTERFNEDFPVKEELVYRTAVLDVPQPIEAE